jgi:hypothetical protein
MRFSIPALDRIIHAIYRSFPISDLDAAGVKVSQTPSVTHSAAFPERIERKETLFCVNTRDKLIFA